MNQHLDPMAVVTMIVGSLLGPHLAAIIGPYAVIFLAATAGAGWNLMKRTEESRSSAFFFMLRVNACAFLLTAPTMSALERWVFSGPVPWLAVPVAFAIGLIGDQWPDLFKPVLERLKNFRIGTP